MAINNTATSTDTYMNIRLIKIGSNSIMHSDNTIRDSNIERLINDIINSDTPSILISSGAISMGKKILGEGYSDAQYFSRGWDALKEVYRDKIGERKQLVTFLMRDNFSDLERQSLLESIFDSLKNDLLVIINHDDTITDSESGKIATRMDNDKNVLRLTQFFNLYKHSIQARINEVIILTNTYGVLNHNGDTLGPYNYDGTLESLSSIKQDLHKHINPEMSPAGTGGMGSKVDTIIECMASGVSAGVIKNAESGIDYSDQNKHNSTIINHI